MNQLLQKLSSQAEQQPDVIAVSDPDVSLSSSALYSAVLQVAESLKPFRGKVVALLADNGIDWVVMDLACLQAGVILLPLPAFFSDSQRHYALEESAAEAIVTDGVNSNDKVISLFGRLGIKPLAANKLAQVPPETVKITFTSGSTGKPKGVCLSDANQYLVAESLLQVTGLTKTRHLCVLPLATLLENVAGIYAPLLCGGEVVVLPATDLGFNGSRGVDINRLLSTIDRVQPDSLILLPELLSGLLISIEQGWQPPNSLKFVAVGGSRVGKGLLEKAHTAGLPVYEGYGLSECSSVVSLNSPIEHQAGTTGKPLPHVDVSVDEGEISVAGNAFLGYINRPESWYPERINTGDLGYMDDQGYLHILGRRKNLLINSFGRNINPEWVESEILTHPMMAQCVVVGDARPYCVALIYPRRPDTPDTEIEQWLSRVNQNLPDYARVVQWIRLSEPLNQTEGTLTANGKPVREQITTRYQTQINDLYKERA